ncbi:hypothetical protein V6Z11_D06G065900 [Gossypium hirsutum]
MEGLLQAGSSYFYYKTLLGGIRTRDCLQCRNMGF